MSRKDQDRLEDLFTEALGLTSEERRSEYLGDACGEDSDLRLRVEELLSSHQQLDSFLEGSPLDGTREADPNATVDISEPTSLVDQRIGHYKILQEIGEGGFGTVYLAEQEQPVRRQVAIKAIKLGMDTKQVIARFEAERQALALMEHPNIANVFDAGATEAGRPYFVMELVRGTTVTEYCAKNRLSIRDRLRLFLPICHAIQHAHQKGVIHRDLKPSNVLVTMREGEPVPKVIDFGIAKATTQRLTDKTLFTEMRQFIGTPEYMSPDQTEASGMDVDTRTDIYSLGVLLYELLTGVTPFDQQNLKGSSYEEVWRIIREVEPPKPSVRASRLTTEETAGDESREHVVTVRQLRGDLDWIVMKALEKDRTRRYATAKDFADDVERHLNHEPVVAGPPGWAYSLRKFVRRHRIAVSAAAVVTAAIVTGLSLAIIGLRNANESRIQLQIERDGARDARAEADRQRTIALEQARESESISAFLKQMLSAADPNQALGNEVTVRFILDEAARKLEEGALTEQPLVEAEIRLSLGQTYRALGLYAAAEKQLRVAWSVNHAILGPEDPAALRSSHALAGLLRVRGRLAEAESLLRRAAETQRRILGSDHPETLATLTELALTLQGPGRDEEAEELLREVYDTRRRIRGDEDETTIEAMVHLGEVCRILGRTEEAQSLLSKGLAECEERLGASHSCTRAALYRLGALREDLNDPAGAEALYRRCYELDVEILGPDHPESAIRRNSLLRVLRALGKVDAMRPLVEDRITRLRDSAQRTNASAHDVHAYAWERIYCELPELRDPTEALPFAQHAVELDKGRDANYLETLAVAYSRNGDPDRAIATQELAIRKVRAGGPYNREEMTRRLTEYKFQKGDWLGVTSLAFSQVTSDLGIGEALVSNAPGQSQVVRSETLMAQGRFEEAAGALRICIGERQKALPPGHWLIAEAKSRLGAALGKDRSFAEAEAALLKSHEALAKDAEVPAEFVDASITRLVTLYEDWERPKEAAEWRSRSSRGTSGGQ